MSEDWCHAPLGLQTTVAASIPPTTQKTPFRLGEVPEYHHP